MFLPFWYILLKCWRIKIIWFLYPSVKRTVLSEKKTVLSIERTVPVSIKNEMRQFAYLNTYNAAIFDLPTKKKEKYLLKSGIPNMIPDFFFIEYMYMDPLIPSLSLRLVTRPLFCCIIICGLYLTAWSFELSSSYIN